MSNSMMMNDDMGVGPHEIKVPNDLVSSVDKRSLQELLCAAKGRFVVCNFLIGTQSAKTVSGFLVNVGSSYFVLRDPCTGVETTCDIFAVKFVSVYPEGVPETQSYCTYRLYRVGV